GSFRGSPSDLGQCHPTGYTVTLWHHRLSVIRQLSALSTLRFSPVKNPRDAMKIPCDAVKIPRDAAKIPRDAVVFHSPRNFTGFRGIIYQSSELFRNSQVGRKTQLL
ncbi:hypothetical protein STEG23_020787, partial [Scotinomys teguina]